MLAQRPNVDIRNTEIIFFLDKSHREKIVFLKIPYEAYLETSLLHPKGL